MIKHARHALWALFLAATALWASAPPEIPEAGPVVAPLVNPTATPVRPAVKAQVDKNELLGHIRFLSSEEMKGREAGSPEQLRAAEYIAAEFERYGLTPCGDEQDGKRTWFQEFHLAESRGFGKDNRLVLTRKEKETTFELRADFAPFSFGASKAEVEAGVAFAGYGIESDEFEYDDFAGLDLRGKWALILRYEPQVNDPTSRFQGKRHTQHAGFAAKLTACLKHGAAGVLLVNPTTMPMGVKDQLTDGKGPVDAEARIPMLHLTREAADAILAASGKRVAELHEAIDKDLKPRSFVLEKTTVKAAIELNVDPRPTRNVLGFLEGSDPELKKQVVILGAHCDHVGLGRMGSLLGREGAGKIHPGADDNASGTAGLLEVAQAFGALQPEQRPKRSILFIAFSGEEKGLLGSAYYVKHPKVPMADLAAMINLDMIGRSEENWLQISGVGTGKSFKELVTRVTKDCGLKVHLGTSGGGPSDHASFSKAGIPVLFLFTGLHPDYHRPGDTWEKINAPVAEQAARIAGELLREIANDPQRPEFRQVAGQGYLGVGPDHIKMRTAVGFPVGSVGKGSPAEEAGLKPGDLIVGVNHLKIRMAMDLSMALLDYGPGDEITVDFVRDDQVQSVDLKLAKRGGAKAPARKDDAKEKEEPPGAAAGD